MRTLPPFLWLSSAVVTFFVAATAPLCAQVQGTDPERAAQMAAAYNDAITKFNAQRWAEAAAGIEKMLTMVGNDKWVEGQLESAYYTLGAAYFNIPNYPSALDTFKKFISKFPNSAHVPEVRLRIAQSTMLNKDYAGAIAIYKELESSPALRDQSLMAQALAYQEMKNKDGMLKVLEKLSGGDIKTGIQGRGAIMLAEIYVGRDEPEKAGTVINRLQAKMDLVDNLVALNAMAVKLGDIFESKSKFDRALSAYRAVQSRAEVIRIQEQRVALLAAKAREIDQIPETSPQSVAKKNMELKQLRPQQEEAENLLKEFQQLPDFAPSLLLRMAKCWYGWEKRWEALVVYERLIAQYPQAKEREMALFGMVLAYADLNMAKRCQGVCEQYLKEFPNGENAGTVGYLSGAVALQVGDAKGAESFFGIMLDKQPQSEYRETMRYLLGNARFGQQKYPEALEDYKLYLAAFPRGEFAEEVQYRIAVVHVFQGNYKDAFAQLQDYVKNYPKGTYLPDARYRIAVCRYAADQHAEVVADCESWERDFKGDQMAGEVFSLKGDALAALSKTAEAADAYKMSVKLATTDEVINYSLFEAGKQLQKLSRWEDVGTLFSDFVREKPDHPATVAALYWVSRAQQKLGKMDEAKALMVETLGKYIAEPKREGVEMMLQQLAQMHLRRPAKIGNEAADEVAKKRAEEWAKSSTEASPSSVAVPVLAAADASPATDTEAVTPSDPNQKPALQLAAVLPTASPWDPVAEMRKTLAPLAKISSPTAQARLLYAEAEMLRLMKKREEEADRVMKDIADRFKPGDLSSVLLALVGEQAQKRGDLTKATEYYQKMKSDFLKSDYLDYAYVGLGQMALGRGDLDTALSLFSDAIDKVTASMKYKEAHIGKAETLLAIATKKVNAEERKGIANEARKLFEMIASIKEWRGDATAQAIFSIGEVEAINGKYAEAIAMYRRVFVGYQKYHVWVARAYLRASDAFDMLGKRRDAIDNLLEMMKNEKLQKLPEYEAARKRLTEWGAAAV